MKYEAVLFDMDGVIVDTEWLHEVAFRETLATHGYELTPDEYKAFFVGKTDRDGLEQYLDSLKRVHDNQAIIDQKSAIYLSVASEQIRPYRGVASLIRQLAEIVPVGLVTGSMRHEAEIAMNTLGILEFFGVTITIEDVKRGKPDPEGYLKAAQLLRIPIQNCVVVEDSVSGVKAAKSAGAPCIAVTNTHTVDELHLADEIVAELSMELFEAARV